MSLLDLVRQTIREHDLAGPATRIVVALSGGSDSMALAHLLRELAAARELQIAGVAHFNHQLRPSADAEEAIVRDEAAALGWPLIAEREEVALRARRERRSIEDAGRTARHAFFARARAHFAADVVAVGHTRDDQAETFLLRLLRGAGARGLASMHPRHGIVVRPLLACRRSALRAYLAEAHVAFVEDESNRDTSIPRNRIRAELLPLLEARFNPAIVDVLADEAEIARDTWQWIEAAADAIAGQPHDSFRSASDRGDGGDRRDDGSLRLDIAALDAAPAAVRRFALWKAMTAVSGGRPIGFAHVAAALRLMKSGRNGSLDAPGQRVARSGGLLVLTGRAAGISGRGPQMSPAARANLFEFPLSIPGEVLLADTGCAVSAELADHIEASAVASNGAVACVRRGVCAGRLTVRNRRPGDRFSPVGLGGRKKLQDFFVDRKIARQDRDLVPLVVDENDRIVWVAGYALDEAFRVTDPAQPVVILRIKRLGGSA
jgi:tRNA(Ile)-lysidine synthase